LVDSGIRVGEPRPRRSTGAKSKPLQRQRNPALTKQDILVSARTEFCEFGLDGARVDRIARRAAANKRLLYHYFGNKEALYSAVLLGAYREIREGERELHLEALAPAEAMRRLVGFTFDHFRRHPWFIRLLATENIQLSRKEITDIKALHSPIVEQIRTVRPPARRRSLRRGVDPIHHLDRRRQLFLFQHPRR
jgi:AcrR family transcriptional regulator